MRKNIFCIICASTFFLSSCSKATESEKKEVDSVTSSTENTSDIETYVEWAVPDLVSISDENVDLFNNMLAENGYDFGLKITTLSFDNYNSELKSISPDIAFTGFDDDDTDVAEELISSGYYENLDSYLENSEIYSQISLMLWDSVKYNGSIYTFPNCTAQDIGVKIIFNLDKIGEESAESFSGTISELSDILGDDGFLLYQLNGIEFVSYYGYELNEGVLISQDCEVLNPFECSDCIDWLSEMNTLYNDGKLIDDDDESDDWSICITKDTERITKENIYTFSTKAILGTRYSASTGILSSSENKDAAFKILELLHSDSDLANCLIYGSDYETVNGYAVDSSGEVIDSYINKLIFGLDESLLWTEDYLLKFDLPEDKIKYYDENVLESPAMDIHLNNDLSNQVEYNTELYKSDNLDEEIQSLKQELEAANIENLISEFSTELSKK